MRHSKSAGICIALLLSLLQPSVVSAQQSKQAPAAPVPAQIMAAKRIFIGNAGDDGWWTDSGPYNGGPDRAYNQFYAAMKSWGHYELVDSPAGADLLFEIGFALPAAATNVSQGNSVGSPPFDPQFRLAIRDPKTHALLWGFTEHSQWAILQGNREKNFDSTLARIVADVERLASPPEVPAGSAKPK